MRRVATILAAVAAAATLSACGARTDEGWSQEATDAGGFNVLTGTELLPEGHLPLDGHGRALPHGHPPVPGYSSGLPEGHPVCPAGRKHLEGGPEGGRGGQDGAQDVIST